MMDKNNNESESNSKIWCFNYKNYVEGIFILSFTVIAIYGIVLLHEVIFSIELRKKESFIYDNLAAFVLIATSIVAGAFLFIRVYIDNQLGIKEKEMNKEYDEKLKKRLDEQTEEMERRLNAKIGEIVSLTLKELKEAGWQSPSTGTQNRQTQGS